MATAMPSNYDWFRDYNEYYYLAFESEYRSIWQGIPEVAKSTEEIYWLCYYRMLMCFLKSDPDSILDRRKLLFYRMASGGFKTTKETDTLVRMRGVLPTKSAVKRTIKQLCTAYDSEPGRRFYEDDTRNDLLATLYAEMHVSSQFPRIYACARLTGLVLARPLFINGAWRVDYLTLDQFRVTTDPDDWTRLASVTYPRAGKDGGVEYVRWTESTVDVYDAKGDRVVNPQNEDGKNPYGVIPFAVCRLSDEQTFDTSGMFELVESQLGVNAMKFLADLSATFVGAPVWFVKNLKQSGLAFSPDMAISVDGVKTGEGMEDAPEVDVIAPPDSYTPLSDYSHELERAMQHAEGIPVTSTATEAGTPPSGEARRIERMEITELRISDQKSLMVFERDFAELTCIVAQVDAGMSKLEPSALQVSVSFAEEGVVMAAQDEYAFDKAKMDDLTMDPREYLRKWAGMESDATDEEMIKAVEGRREFFDMLKAAKGGPDKSASSQLAPTPIPAEPVIPTDSEDENIIIENVK